MLEKVGAVRGGERISAHDVTAKSHPVPRPDAGADRHEGIRQYSLAQILGVWAAAAIPMGVLAWLVAPLLGALLGGGDTAFIKRLV